MGETLTILRRRESNTQTDFAASSYVSQMTVSLWESDAIKFPGDIEKIKLTQGEECYLLRRRLGLNLKETARKIGVSHVTLIKWEKENPPDTEYLRYLVKQEEKQNGE